MNLGDKFHLKARDITFTFLPSGDIYEISHKETMINQWLSNPIDGALNNIYLRIYRNWDITAVPLIGVRSNSEIFTTEKYVKWKGFFEDVNYEVTFYITDAGVWFWDILLTGEDIEVDLIYAQDLGLADKSAVRSNEAYMSQYMDHSIFKDKQKGYVICTRQNQPQKSGFPYIQQGALSKVVGYSTDGLQFFGLSYKTTNQAEVLTKPCLANKNYQYEFAYTALQSEKLNLNGERHFVFYGLFKENHSSAIQELEFDHEIKKAWSYIRSESKDSSPLERVRLLSTIGEPLQTLEMTAQEIEKYFPNRQLEEFAQETLLSFFTDTYEHVVLKRKEELVERPHGHIIMSGHNDQVREDTMSTTSYMYGIFNSQLAIGNTSMNKMITNARNPLNIMKTSGQRIYIQIDRTYRLLTMPSMFEIGFNYARWYYKFLDDVIVITNLTKVDAAVLQLHVRSEKGKAYRFIVTNQVTMNNNEYEVPFHIKQNGNIVVCTADSKSDSAAVYPELNYYIHVTGTKIAVSDERELATNITPLSTSLLVMTMSPTAKWKLNVQGSLTKQEHLIQLSDIAKEIERYRIYYRQVNKGFKLTTSGKSTRELEKINTLAWWYTHHMLVHFSSPHGLEQYGGAAWGTRDVCQGPTEYFLATQNDQAVRDIIKTVFSHQYEDTGNWPQWFMFDKYTRVQQEESHGDIIVWPLKVVADYLEATGDYSILEEAVPYTDRGTFAFTARKATIMEHLLKEVDYIKNHFAHHTFLSLYDDGDWDDTLQPANEHLKKYMSSSWTVALTYQVLQKMAQALAVYDEKESSKMKELASGVESDFKRYILSENIIPGFVYMEKPGNIEFMLHPTDSKTGIHYRLLPMQRSIISELFTKEQAEQHYKLIKEHLYFPDGVRLMNRPANYEGGVSTHFKRAEQAANFGREVGLQYVHAHIRFVEAMAKLGYDHEVWKGLSVINPILIQEEIPHAEIRQSNTYFSSSDGKFATRYEAREKFAQLRTGDVAVKSGWRIYSSGPGIYMNQLISNALGIRRQQGNLVIDPVLPMELDQLEFTFQYVGKPVTYQYHLQHGKKQVIINGNNVDITSLADNPYRDGAIMVQAEELEKYLQTDENKVEIYL
ncbi:GH36-type glycosyl hydrolase domain-containing protein [Virgibacillus pantothenticus]|uniref:Cellobiose phosphorylase n=1 Tax=Virgibacillus pantothenticus TaxID=1473 RepID=A0A0L0QUT3_VIRPA|nr:cellobiose phosphorylase [Virgibacillus pantothenticus]KNE22344.1 cellobiose phosphorylase [Virgibacillus pantothenticus]SIS86957.1 Cellobiose phosphorylase [Virgibacillus pantothenticus]